VPRVISISKLGEESWATPHPEIRFIVLRRVGDDDENETCLVVGFLKHGSNLLVDGAGNLIGGTPEPGDLIFWSMGPET